MLRVVQASRHRFIRRMIRGISACCVLSDARSRYEVAEVMEDLQLAGRIADMRNAHASVQIGVGDELTPQADGIPVQANEADGTHVELPGVEFRSTLS